MLFFKKNKEPKKNSKFKQFRTKFANLSRFVFIFGTYFILSVVVGIMLLARIQGSKELKVVENGISTVVSPIQNGFSRVVDLVANQLRTIKLRGQIEKEYNRLLAENEQLVYEAMLANELKIELSQYKSIADEILVNNALNPIAARVIGKTPGNYFSVFTINKGSADGLEDFMAVTANGALIGYTYNVSLNKADVRTIIDSQASIAALIQTSRDQGTIRGSLGIDGKPLCRMYYLPDENLPRPGDDVVTSGVGMAFPRGIPIGTVRESTRGLEENKLYIVVEPKVDFKHIENVIVLRYKPEAIGVTAKENGNELTIYDPIPSMMPIPTIMLGKDEVRLEPTPAPTTEIDIPVEEKETKTTAKPVETPKEPSSLGEYIVPNAQNTPQIKFTLGPTASPTPSPAPLDVTFEDD